MKVRVSSHREPEPLNLEAFERLAVFALEREDVPEQAELSIGLVDADEMTGLNQRYRGQEGPTDVLAFPCDDPCPAVGDEPITLGDVIIAPDVGQAQAAKMGTTVEEELNLLLVHGILHILGYEHETEDDAAAMHAREESILQAYEDLG